MNNPTIELVALVLMSLFLLAGAVLVWRKRFAPGCALIGAAAGLAAPLFVCGFRVGVSSFGGVVFFEVGDQDSFDVLWSFADAAQAEALAARLNALLLVVGAAGGAAFGLLASWMLRRRLGTGQGRPTP
jgi:hypothetical protein